MSPNTAKKIFCLGLTAVLAAAGWAAFDPTSAQASHCEVLCLDVPGICPPGQFINIGMRSTGFGTCCVGCGSGCLPLSECRFGNNCDTLCRF